jgi:N-methylhydantoinase B
MNRVHRSDGTAEVLPVLLTRTVPMRKGDLFHHVMAGGGGYGDPLERDPALVLRDVVEERVTRAHAAAAYGVAIADGPKPSVDAAATAALRTRLRQARST